MIRTACPEQANRFAALSLALDLADILVTLLPAVVVGSAGVFALIGDVLGTAPQ